MWIEITDTAGNVIGATNSECCDLMRIDTADPRKAEGGALIRNISNGDSEVYKTKVSYLRLIETLTQTEIQNLVNLNEIIEDVKGKEDAPRIVMPG
jgi:hypothetical protein